MYLEHLKNEWFLVPRCPILIIFFFFFFFFSLLFVFCFYKYSRYFIFLLRLVTLICFSGNVQLSNGSNFNDRDSGSRRKLLNAWYRDALSASPALNLCNNLFSGSHVEFVGLYVRGMCCCCSPRLLPKTNSFPENTGFHVLLEHSKYRFSCN